MRMSNCISEVCSSDRAVSDRRPRTRDAHEGPAGEALQVSVGERRVGGDDDDDRAVGGVGRDLVLQIILAERLADGRPVDDQVAAIIALDEYADRVATEVRGQLAGTGADTALPAERDRARAGTNPIGRATGRARVCQYV